MKSVPLSEKEKKLQNSAPDTAGDGVLGHEGTDAAMDAAGFCERVQRAGLSTRDRQQLSGIARLPRKPQGAPCS